MRSKHSVPMWSGVIALGFAAVAMPAAAANAAATPPWLDAQRPPDERARLAVAAMTLEEKIRLVHGLMAFDTHDADGRPVSVPPDAIADSAGFVPGVARLGIPALFETDASLGVANPMDVRGHDVATALPAGLVLGSTFDPDLAYRAGAMVGAEAHAKGYNVLLGGGMNLVRDPRNGRNFEYLSEDPWESGLLAAAAVRGTQDQHVLSTVKHFALNANETDRWTLDARIDRAALRESDLLAFQIAIERGAPGSVMCAYNKVNGDYACSNDWLLNQVLKKDWGYPGWVMSDWGAVHGAIDAKNGLDQQSGEQLDRRVWFDGPLKAALAGGEVPRARLDDMVRRILRSMWTVGIDQHPPVRTPIDYPAHDALALEIAQKGIVLLKNEGGLLPLAAGAKRIAVIGGHANLGVLSGGGSSQVMPANGPFFRVPVGGNGFMADFRNETYAGDAPLAAIRGLSPSSEVLYDPGIYPLEAAALAAHSDVAIVFVTAHSLEGYDVPSMQLPQGQDAMVAAVARANPRTVVVLETGNPVTMPWVNLAPAIVAAWYPGQAGGRAIADILFGRVNPSGRLPVSFPRVEGDFVRPALPNLGAEKSAEVAIEYTEGADVGYRRYAARSITPLFAFGHGLTYTRFRYAGLRVEGGDTLKVSFDVTNSGARAGADIPQVYLTSAAGKPVFRLIGFSRVELAPGETRRVTLTADRRLLGTFDEKAGVWNLAGGVYRAQLGASAAGASGPQAEGGEARVRAQHGALHGG